MPRATGIDYGSHSLKVAEVRWSGKTAVLSKAAWLPLGPEGNGEDLPGRVGAKEIRVGGGIFGVSGRDSILRYTHVPPVPPWRMKLIMNYEIGEIASKGGGDISADYQLLNVPRDVSQDLTILVGMAKDEKVSSRIETLQGAGLSARSACPTSLALYNAFRVLGEEIEEAALLVDIGHENMDIAISQAGHLIFARSVQLGGKDFTEAVASSLGVPHPEAEKIKHDIGAIKREGWKNPREREVCDSLMGVVGNLLSVIQSSVKFCKAQTHISDLRVQKVFLSGGGARLRGLVEHLSRSMNLPVEIFDPLSGMDLRPLSPEAQKEAQARSLELVVPIGLALSEDRTAGFRLDLLPTPMKAKREFRSRTVFLYVAGILVALAILLNVFGAIKAKWQAGSRGEQLAGIRDEARTRNNDWKELSESNNLRKADLEALTWETRPGYFLSVLLDAIGTSAPSQIAISEIALERGGKAGTPKRPFSYRISGIADDATGMAFSILEGFQRTLDKVPEFASAIIDTSKTRHDPRAGVWRFDLVVTPVDGDPPK